MKRVITIACLMALGSMILLSSCFYPEKFHIKINIDKQGTYSFLYDGTLVYIAEGEGKDKKVMSDEDEKAIKEIEAIIKKDKNFKDVTYSGHGRFKVLYSKEGSTKDVMSFFQDNQIISIEPVALDVVIIKATPMNKELADLLKKNNIKIEGSISVTTNATVIQHNATNTPTFFGLFGAYDWQITSFEGPEPVMVLKVK